MRTATTLLLVLSACPTVPPPVPVPPLSRFNGVWASPRDDAGLREGILVHDLLDGGVAWSPLRLEFLDGRLVLTHHCRDFRVDSATGQVLAVAGVVPAGVVTEGAADFNLLWTADTFALSQAHMDLRSSFGLVSETRLRGAASDGSVRLRMEFLFPDASIADIDLREFPASRQFTCE